MLLATIITRAVLARLIVTAPQSANALLVGLQLLLIARPFDNAEGAMSAPAMLPFTTSAPLTALALTSGAITWAPGPRSSDCTVFEPLKATALPPSATNSAMQATIIAGLGRNRERIGPLT